MLIFQKDFVTHPSGGDPQTCRARLNPGGAAPVGGLPFGFATPRKDEEMLGDTKQSLLRPSVISVYCFGA